jgi:glycerol kinase
MAYQTCDLLRAMQQDAATPLAELKADGGASVNDGLLQFQADLLGMPVVRPVVTETTAMGAAYLAGLAVDFWNDQAELAKHWAAERRFTPMMPTDERDRRYRQWQRAVERTRGWAIEE